MFLHLPKQKPLKVSYIHLKQESLRFFYIHQKQKSLKTSFRYLSRKNLEYSLQPKYVSHFLFMERFCFTMFYYIFFPYSSFCISSSERFLYCSQPFRTFCLFFFYRNILMPFIRFYLKRIFFSQYLADKSLDIFIYEKKLYNKINLQKMLLYYHCSFSYRYNS